MSINRFSTRIQIRPQHLRRFKKALGFGLGQRHRMQERKFGTDGDDDHDARSAAPAAIVTAGGWIDEE